MNRSHRHQVCQWNNVTKYYVIDSRAVEKIWCVIQSNPMYFVTTLCYLSTRKELCAYRYGCLDTQKQSEMHHHCDSVCIEVHGPQIDERIRKGKTTEYVL